ncbi:outer membrane receptor protein involved in Fe transport [Balneicella halophila]|uniref:Outer membrane receptor protein involved in Fe transport n=2 Tax=Balneicella halophila TaxID=1537566 RepID=A0A7L4UQQ4_BALHA|nr:outer membrane receptor protein involved in Fe transport [Balneicella halophila]
MKNRVFVLLMFLISSVSLLIANPTAKRDITISGQVLHKSTGLPLEYATVAFLYKDGQVAGGGITNEKGRFSIDIPKGTYDVSVEFIGFKPQLVEDQRLNNSVDLGVMRLAEDATMLDEVEVIAEKTTVELKLDKKIYNVGKDLTVSGGSVSDVLDNVPSVSVDVEGNVALRGNDNVRILINGKPSGLVGLNSTEALRQLPAEAIEKVEVITSPSARYDAEGTAGILNIILRRSKMQGFNGAITTSIGYPLSGGISANLNYRVGDFNFFTTSGYRYRENEGYSDSKSQYYNIKEDPITGETVDLPDTYMNEHSDNERERRSYNTNLGVEWYLNKSTSLTVSALLRDSDGDSKRENHIQQFDTSKNLIAESFRVEDEERDDKVVEYALNFTKNFNDDGHKLTIDASYEDDKELEDGVIVMDGFNDETVLTDETQERFLVQADYIYPFSDTGNFEFGYRGNFNDRNTDYQVALWDASVNDFVLDQNVSNILGYKEQVNALYTQYGNMIGEKFSYLLGLRFEHTSVDIEQKTSADFREKDYNDLFPTMNLSYKMSDKQSVTLGYARRIRRPRSRMINPFPSRASLTSIFQGNPDIDPSYSNTFDVGYLNRFGKLNLSSSLYYTHATDVFNMVSFDTGNTVVVNGKEVPVVRRSPINLATQDRLGFEATLSYNPSRKWRMNGNINLFHSKIEGSYNGTSYDADNFSWFARISNKLTLPGKIDWQTRLTYIGPRENSQNKYDGMLFTNMALSKDFFDDKASVTFNVSDIFGTHNHTMETTTPTYFNESEFQWRGRTFNLSFTYRFNQSKRQSMKNRRMMNDEDGGEEQGFF